ncbi:hypothetical protein [Actinomadura chibensis]|uniref:Peptidase inhibitor family I36 protein n=1 Tax=Actinomadura chibensis TaxID=392828 RepID=A0A5D0NUT5_9ACTN|nr:hypothetical protein [Actinomadura chibensis]TYB48155.1 hypothetical protein FXF69_02735 [Actinomadura chibensis]
MTTFDYRRWSGTRAAVLAACAVIGTAAMATISAPDAPAGKRGRHGCAHGHVCVYAGSGWNEARLAVPGSSRVVGLRAYLGKHRVFNNTDRAAVRFCTGHDAQGCGAPLGPGRWTDREFTPVDSLVIQG